MNQKGAAGRESIVEMSENVSREEEPSYIPIQGTVESVFIILFYLVCMLPPPIHVLFDY